MVTLVQCHDPEEDPQLLRMSRSSFPQEPDTQQDNKLRFQQEHETQQQEKQVQILEELETQPESQPELPVLRRPETQNTQLLMSGNSANWQDNQLPINSQMLKTQQGNQVFENQQVTQNEPCTCSCPCPAGPPGQPGIQGPKGMAKYCEYYLILGV